MALDGHPKWLTDVRVNVCKRPRKRPRKSLQTLEECTVAFVKVLQTKGLESLQTFTWMFANVYVDVCKPLSRTPKGTHLVTTSLWGVGGAGAPTQGATGHLQMTT